MEEYNYDNIKRLLLKADLRGAITCLLEYDLDKSTLKEVEILLSRLSEIERRNRGGILREEDYKVERNVIRKAILDLLDKDKSYGIVQKKPLITINKNPIYSLAILVSIPLVLLIFFTLKGYNKKESLKSTQKKEINETVNSNNIGKIITDIQISHDIKKKEKKEKKEKIDFSQITNDSIMFFSSFDYSKGLEGGNIMIFDSLLSLKRFDEALEILYRLNMDDRHSNLKEAIAREVAAISILKGYALDEVESGYPGEFILGIKNKKWGLFNTSLQMIAKVKYDYIDPIPSDPIIYITRIKDKYGLLNPDGEEVLKPIYHSVSKDFFPLFRIEKKGKYGLVNREGFIVQEAIYDDIRPELYGIMKAQIKSKWGFIDTLGNIVIDFEYEHVETYEQGQVFAVKKDKEFILNMEGDIIKEIK